MTDYSHKMGMPVDLPPNLQMGVFANAVRIIPDSDQDYFVDFLVYSASEKKAVVIARIRIHESLLKPFRERIDLTLSSRQEALAAPEVSKKPHLVQFTVPKPSPPLVPVPIEDVFLTPEDPEPAS